MSPTRCVRWSQQHKPRVLALDMSRVSDLEYSALQALMEGEKRATGAGAVVWLVGLNPSVLEIVDAPGWPTTRPRADAVQRACCDRALPGAAGGGRDAADCGVLITDIPVRRNETGDLVAGDRAHPAAAWTHGRDGAS